MPRRASRIRRAACSARLASDPKASPDAAATAGVTLIGVLIAEGKLEEADSRLADLKKSLSVEEAERLTHQVARGWLHQGKLDRAEALVKADSTVEGMAIRGRARALPGRHRRRAARPGGRRSVRFRSG